MKNYYRIQIIAGLCCSLLRFVPVLRNTFLCSDSRDMYTQAQVWWMKGISLEVDDQTTNEKNSYLLKRILCTSARSSAMPPVSLFHPWEVSFREVFQDAMYLSATSWCMKQWNFVERNSAATSGDNACVERPILSTIVLLVFFWRKIQRDCRSKWTMKFHKLSSFQLVPSITSFSSTCSTDPQDSPSSSSPWTSATNCASGLVSSTFRLFLSSLTGCIWCVESQLDHRFCIT